MMYPRNPLRPGMTAIAAVLVLTSTPLLAQSADVAPAAPPQPALIAPPPADASVAMSPAPQGANGTPTAGVNIPHIAINMDDAPNSATTRPVVRAPSAAISTKAAKTVRAAPSTTLPVERTAATELLSAERAAPPIAEDNIAAVPVAPEQRVDNPAPVAKPQPVTQSQSADDLLPVAGAIGLGAIALLGGAFAFGRRKGRDEELELVQEANAEPALREEMLLTEPAPGYASQVARADVPLTAIPTGFDLSGHGRHVQAAYRGPTEDNPSLSLKNRLKRARFFDQRERMAAAPAMARPEARAEAAAPRAPAIAERRTDHVVSRPSNRANQGFRPAYQS